jgi:hypothetical protein
MIEYHFNEEEYLNNGLMFSREVHENVNIFFHGTSGQYHEDICKEGLVGPGEGLVSKKRVQMVVDFYSDISWEGKKGGGYPISTLTGFTLSGDYKDREKKLVYVTEEAHEAIRYAQANHAGGETVTAIRLCFKELVNLSKSPEEMANLDIDPEIVSSFIRKNRDIIDHAEKTLEQHLFGCVYAIQFDESEQLPSKGAPGAGARYTIEDVDVEKIIAFCKIPNNIDRKTVYYSQSYEMRKRLADLKKGSR